MAIGKRFGKWTIVEKEPKKGQVYDRYKCKCDCGVFGVVRLGALRNSRSKSCKACGYLSKSKPDEMIGKTFGSWRVLERSPLKNKNNLSVLFICECECNKIQHVRADALRTGNTNQCTACTKKLIPKNRRCKFCKCKDHKGIVLENCECDFLGVCAQCDQFNIKSFAMNIC